MAACAVAFPPLDTGPMVYLRWHGSADLSSFVSKLRSSGTVRGLYAF